MIETGNQFKLLEYRVEPLFPFSREEYQARVRRVFELMSRRRLDALLCHASRIMPGNVRYLTGYETRLGIHDAAYLLLVPDGPQEATLFSNASWEHPEEETWVADIVITSDFGQEIASRLPSSARTLGVAGFKYLPAPVYVEISRSVPHLEFIDVTADLMSQRLVKSDAEVALLRRCAALTDHAGHAFLRAARAGVTEREIAAEVEYAMKRNGSDEVSFTTQVGCGERTSRVVVYPGDTQLAQGDPVQLDCGATLYGYRGDLSRVVVVGKPSPEYRRMLDATEEMYFKCIEVLRPGVSGAEVARVGIDTARAHGLEQFLYRSPNHNSGFMAHGIGCHYAESPEITPEDGTILEPNMVLVVEPILMWPGVGGVKIEDAVLVTANGAERFSTCPIHTWDA